MTLPVGGKRPPHAPQAPGNLAAEIRLGPVMAARDTGVARISEHPTPRGRGASTGGCGTLADVLATVSFFYGHRDPVSVTAG